MAYCYQIWDQTCLEDNVMTQDYHDYGIDMSASLLDQIIMEMDRYPQAFNDMQTYLNEVEKPYYPTSAQDFMFGRTSPFPISSHDQPYDPSSPEGSESSDLSSMPENDLFMPVQSWHMPSAAESAYSSEPAGISTNKSRSTTFMDTQQLAHPFHGSGAAYCQNSTTTLRDIQGSSDMDMYKAEGDYDDFDGIKMDVNVLPLHLEMMHPQPTYLPHFYTRGSGNIPSKISPASTPQRTIGAEEDHEELSDTECAESGDNASDADWKPSGSARRNNRAINRPIIRRIIPRSSTISATPKAYRVTKSKPTHRRTISLSIKAIAQLSGEHKHPCVFSFAGCQAMWKTKNEWKRHAMTQHLVLESYQCKLCKRDGGDHGKGKGKGKNTAWQSGSDVEGQVFNRKDLFTQHLKRMHTPTMYKQCAKNGSGEQKKMYEEWIREQQELARFDTGRMAPNESMCPKAGCKQTFTGRKGWDERLEHIWKHFETGDFVGADMGDGGLRDWAINSGVAFQDSNGNLALKECTTEEKSGSEVDAPGDYE